MPTYEYRCNACGRDFEYIQKMSDDDLVVCEECGQPKLEKLISRTAFQLKGTGWYKDLYSSNPAQSQDLKDSVDKTPHVATETKAEPRKYGEGKKETSGGSSSGGDSGGSSSGSSSGGTSSGGSSSGGGTSGGGSSSGGSSSTSSS